MELKITKKAWMPHLIRAVLDRRLYAADVLAATNLVFRGYSVDQIRSLGLVGNRWAVAYPEINRYLFTINTNRFVWPLLHDKMLFDLYFSGRLPIIRAIFFVILGRLQGNSGEQFDIEECLLARSKTGDRFLIKPLRGGEGKGISFIEKLEENRYLVGGRRMRPDEVLRHISGFDYHGIYPFVEQHPVVKGVYPDATNTLRIVAYRNRSTGEVGFYSPRLRVGTRCSRPLDNISQGGLACRISDDGGITFRSCALEQGVFKIIDKHPDTGRSLNGVKIPFWHEIRAVLTHFHEKNPEFDLVGWDILIGTESWYVIEGNHNPTLRVNYFFDPLDAPEQEGFRRHLRSLGILKEESVRTQ